jgi:hypothetical protein
MTDHKWCTICSVLCQWQFTAYFCPLFIDFCVLTWSVCLFPNSQSSISPLALPPVLAVCLHWIPSYSCDAVLRTCAVCWSVIVGSVCVCVCVCVCCVWVSLCVCVCTCLCACVHGCSYVCVCVYACVCISLWCVLCLCICVSVCMCVTSSQANWTAPALKLLITTGMQPLF